MSKFIILHQQSGNKPVFVNVGLIMYFSQMDGYTKVMLAGKDTGINVVERADDIDSMIKG